MVHWDRKGARRRIMIQIGVLLGLLTIVALSYERRNEGLKSDAIPLEMISKEILPLKEISGMAKVKVDGEERVLIIGDDKAKVYWLHDGKEVSFKNAMVEKFSLCQTEEFDECDRMIKKLTKNWEGLAADGTGRIFLLQEHTQSILVAEPGFDSFAHALHYNFGQAFTEAVGKGSRKVRKNALGEGLILLKNGHVLIAKENYPVALVEFGPEGHDPLGLNPSTVLPPDEAFTFTGESFHQKLIPLHSWTLATHGKCDISDLALDKNLELLTLSEDCLTIQRYKALVPNEEPVLSDVFLLPGEVRSPEALISLGDEWLVGSDVASKKQTNFYRLKAQGSLK